MSFLTHKRIVFDNDVIFHYNLEEKVPITSEKGLGSNGVATFLLTGVRRISDRRARDQNVDPSALGEIRK